MMDNFQIWGRSFALLIAASFLNACSTLPRNPVPADRIKQARIQGMPDTIRALGLTKSAALQSDFAQAMVDGGSGQACDTRDASPVFCVLIISGGGGFGAYGAGLMNGWTKSGTRPEFKIVTGISTGSLIAPFAFLGPEWDDKLTAAYTSLESDDDVIEQRNIVGILTSDSIATNEPFVEKLATYVDQKLIDAIAREHEGGRRLYVGTTNMDAQRFTVWNMGAIAASGDPKASELFRSVLLASASIPIIMPPVLFNVELDGQPFDEMHADGGVQAQFFVPLSVINLPEAIKEAQDAGFNYAPTPRMFIIRNAKFTPEPKSVDRNLGAIAARTVSSLIQAMGRSDLYQIYSITRARGNDFHYTEVPADFLWESDQEFDGPEMRRLYNIGAQRGLSGDAWQTTPPGLFVQNTAQQTRLQAIGRGTLQSTLSSDP